MATVEVIKPKDLPFTRATESTEQRTFKGLDITIEYQKGEIKPNKENPDDPYCGWMMYADYGYINDTISNEEGEEMDVFIGPDPESEMAFSATMLCDDEITVDEQKILLGFKDYKAAVDFINLQYGSWRVAGVTEISLKDLQEQVSLQRQKNQKEKLLQAAEGIDGTTAPELDTGPEMNEYGQDSEQPQLVVQV